MTLHWMNWLHLKPIAILPFTKHFQHLSLVFGLQLLCMELVLIDSSPMEAHQTMIMTKVNKSVLHT